MDEKWLVQYESAIEHIWHAAASTEQENDAKIKNEWKKKLKKQNVLDYARAHGLIKEEQPNKKAKLNKEMIIKVCKEGQWYDPAWKHYTHSGSYSAVQCDGCGKENLMAAYGWNIFDVCQDCAHKHQRTCVIL